MNSSVGNLYSKEPSSVRHCFIYDTNRDEMKSMITFIKKYRLAFLGFLIGAIVGLLYWWFIGCTNGACSITSSPFYSSLWGALLGVLVFDAFRKNE